MPSCTSSGPRRMSRCDSSRLAGGEGYDAVGEMDGVRRVSLGLADGDGLGEGTRVPYSSSIVCRRTVRLPDSGDCSIRSYATRAWGGSLEKYRTSAERGTPPTWVNTLAPAPPVDPTRRYSVPSVTLADGLWKCPEMTRGV